MGRQILAVDDNEIVGWTLAARLWVAGYEVETVCSAGEAFMALKQKRYDLVLMDLQMPDMDGLSALEKLMREDLCAGAPVVLLTGSEDFDLVRKAYALGARGYLTKGCATTALIKNIDRLMKTQDVVWLDDLHCVSTQRAAHDDPSSKAPSFLTVVAPSSEPGSPSPASPRSAKASVSLPPAFSASAPRRLM